MKYSSRDKQIANHKNANARSLGSSKIKGRQKSQFKVEQLVSEKIGRNESCPCGSNKKYKKCHLKKENK
jgi:uncharacterized protein YecA (UPF0149 family)